LQGERLLLVVVVTFAALDLGVGVAMAIVRGAVTVMDLGVGVVMAIVRGALTVMDLGVGVVVAIVRGALTVMTIGVGVVVTVGMPGAGLRMLSAVSASGPVSVGDPVGTLSRVGAVMGSLSAVAAALAFGVRARVCVTIIADVVARPVAVG
jgi:hypothetical protein